MTTLLEQVGGTPIAETPEFKAIVAKILASNKSDPTSKKVQIEKPSKAIVFELRRQGFDLLKDNYKTVYGCGYEDRWNPCDCNRCRFDQNGTKLYRYYVVWQ
jgi:hypothetical protein